MSNQRKLARTRARAQRENATLMAAAERASSANPGGPVNLGTADVKVVSTPRGANPQGASSGPPPGFGAPRGMNPQGAPPPGFGAPPQGAPRGMNPQAPQGGGGSPISAPQPIGTADVRVVSRGSNAGGSVVSRPRGNVMAVAGSRNFQRPESSVSVVPGNQASSNAKVQPRQSGAARVIPSAGPRRPMQPPKTPTQPAPSQFQQQQLPQPQQQQGNTGDVTVILSCFERPNMFRRQLEALRNQSVQPHNILVWVNAGSVAQDERGLSGAGVTVIRANANLGPWARFSLAVDVATKYVCILDDDTIPGPQWIEACIERLERAEAEQDEETTTFCIASAGEILQEDGFANRAYVGAERPSTDAEEMEVDVGRQGWFFRKDLIGLFLSYPRQGDGQIGWGLHFAAALQAHNLFTIVLPYESGNAQAWGMTQPASQDRSVSLAISMKAQTRSTPTVEELEDNIYQAYRQIGWEPMIMELEEGEEPSQELPQEEDSAEGIGANSEAG